MDFFDSKVSFSISHLKYSEHEQVCDAASFQIGIFVCAPNLWKRPSEVHNCTGSMVEVVSLSATSVLFIFKRRKHVLNHYFILLLNALSITS